jgi:hypothetical protein
MPTNTSLPAWSLRQHLDPVRASILGSLVLSGLAFAFGLLDKDGMLYMETAHIYLEQGFKAALANFAWPFHPMLVAWLSQLTSLELDTSRMLLMGFYQAGICALLVAAGRRLHPESAWYLVLVVLALPGLNGHRDEFIREYGAWFFILLALWLALVWGDRCKDRWGADAVQAKASPSPATWPLALGAQCSLGLAALYRPESLAIYPALVLWQWFALGKTGRWRRTLEMAALPSLLLGLIIGLLLYKNLGDRMTGELHRLTLSNFQARTQALSTVLPVYGAKHAGLILLVGSLAIIPLTFVLKTKLLSLPLVFACYRQPCSEALGRFALFAWAFGLHLLVLMVFALEMQFVDGRYIAPLALFAAPLMGHSLWRLAKARPRWRYLLIGLGLIIALDNLHLFSQKKTQFIEAGHWVAQHIKTQERVYLNSPRTAYHAGWGYRRWHKPADNWAALRAGLAAGDYDWLVLEFSRHEQAIPAQLEALGLETIKHFSIPKGDSVLVTRPLIKNSVKTSTEPSPP